MTLKLYRVILPVSDIKLATQFYSDLLEDKGSRVSPGRHYFNLGGIILACYSPGDDGDPMGEWKMHDNQYIYIATSKLEKMYEKCKELVPEHTEDIAEMPWGERLFYSKDPFGNPICFVDESTLFVG